MKPLFPQYVHLRNLFTHQDLLRKRPKAPLQFKFSMFDFSESYPPLKIPEKLVQLKLLRALKAIKPIFKIDLKEFEVKNYDFWEATLISACKKFAHVRTLLLLSPKKDGEVKYLKYFSKLKICFINSMAIR